MKHIIKYLSIFAVLAAVIISAGSCKKTNKTTAATGTFYFHIHTDIDTSEVDDTAALYSDATGRHIGLTTGNFIISNITLKNADGSTYAMSGVQILKTIDSEEYIIGTAPVGVYTSVSFNIGDLSANVLRPTASLFYTTISGNGMLYGASDSSSTGCMNFKIKGFADTTAGQTGTNPVHFSYEIGGDARIRTVTMPTRGTAAYPTNYVLTSGGTQYIHLIADYGKLLSVMDFKTQDSTNGYSIHPAIADSIANNIPNMFRYEE